MHPLVEFQWVEFDHSLTFLIAAHHIHKVVACKEDFKGSMSRHARMLCMFSSYWCHCTTFPLQQHRFEFRPCVPAPSLTLSLNAAIPRRGIVQLSKQGCEFSFLQLLSSPCHCSQLQGHVELVFDFGEAHFQPSIEFIDAVGRRENTIQSQEPCLILLGKMHDSSRPWHVLVLNRYSSCSRMSRNQSTRQPRL